MAPILKFLVFVVAIEHLWFLVLEMFLWTKPLGMKAFHTTSEFANATANLAANQGLYNGFLSAGLLYSLFFSPSAEVTSAFQWFFLVCVAVAGIYGGLTVSKQIFFMQGLPALLALGLKLGV